MKKIVAVFALILFISSAAAFSADKASIIYIEGDVIMNGSPASVGDDVKPGATLQQGAIGMVLRNLGSLTAGPGELRFRITTSNTVAGVRGTCFLVKIEDDNNTFICCCNGRIHLEGTGGVFTQNMASSHHEELRVRRSERGISVAAAPLLYHTDADVEAIAARIGETIDWTRIDK
jgi:hypothetical protein